MCVWSDRRRFPQSCQRSQRRKLGCIEDCEKKVYYICGDGGSPLFLSHDLKWAQLVALVAGAQLSICVSAPSIKQALICKCQGVGIAWNNLKRRKIFDIKPTKPNQQSKIWKPFCHPSLEEFSSILFRDLKQKGTSKKWIDIAPIQ